MDKRDQIINAAVECFSTYGYSKTSMSDIGRMVGMNKASLYYHFKDKLDLYSAVVWKMRSEHLSRFDRKEGIIAFLQREIDFSGNVSMNIFTANQGHAHHKEETKTVFDAVIREDAEIVSSMLEEEMNEGKIRRENALALAKRIMTVSQGLLLAMCPLDMPLSEREEGYQAVKREIAEVVGLILKGLSV